MKIGFIGIGNMGGAILSGYAPAAVASGVELAACDRNEELCQQTVARIPSLELYKEGKDLAKDSDIIVLGVKPQVIEGVLAEIVGAYTSDKLIVSMAAGVSVEHVASFFDGEPQIIRIMPNTPAKVGEAMTAICKNDNVTEENLQRALDIFNTVGKAEVIDESLMDCVIGVSGSSPAYTYMYIEALAQAACDEGMDEAKAKTFAAQAVLGAAKMALESPESLEQLRINVCSPNGTTIEAVDALMANGFMDKVKEGFKAAADRSREMTREKLEKQKVQEAKG